MLLETYDAKVIEQLKEGMEVRCGVGHNIREYQGHTYNEVKLYRIEFQTAQQEATSTQQQAEQPAPSADVTEENDGDAPF